eukprot:3625849-Rhodomonas_salina.2
MKLTSNAPPIGPRPLKNVPVHGGLTHVSLIEIVGSAGPMIPMVKSVSFAMPGLMISWPCALRIWIKNFCGPVVPLPWTFKGLSGMRIWLPVKTDCAATGGPKSSTMLAVYCKSIVPDLEMVISTSDGRSAE